MVEKIIINVDRLLLVKKNEKSPVLAKSIEKFVFVIKSESGLSTFVFIFSTISQILEIIFYVI